MRLLFWMAFLLPVLGMYLLSFTLSTGRRELAIHAAGWATIAVAVLIVLTLVFARGPACRLLSGHWNGSSCANEIGGNGDGS